MNVDFKQILEELKLKGIIEQSFNEVGPLSTDRNSKVGVISQNGESKFIIKVHNPAHIKAETTFLKAYQKSSLTPQIVYIDPEFRFFVYHYIPGDRVKENFNKKEWLDNITENYINNYTLSDQDKWGYLDNPCPTYKDVLQSDVDYYSPLASQKLSREDYQLVMKCVDEVGPVFQSEKYLVHGDLGIHNSLFNQGKLVAIIDSYPLVAPPVYDLVYAFCSNTKEFEIDLLREVVSKLKVWEKDESILVKHLLISLYCRIGTCIKHYPESISVYLEAWDFWKKTLHNM